MGFNPEEWLGFFATFAIVVIPWFAVYGLGYYSLWYNELQRKMRERWSGAYKAPGWLFMILNFIVMILAWIAIFLFWKSGEPSERYEWGIIIFLITLVLAKLFEPIYFGGENAQTWWSVRARLIWLAFHAFLILAGTVITAILFGLAANELSNTNLWVAMSFIILWGLFAIFAFAWAVMAAHTWSTRVGELSQERTSYLARSQFQPVPVPIQAPFFRQYWASPHVMLRRPASGGFQR